MPGFERDGVTINYFTRGDPSTPPVLLLHAFASDGRMWSPVAEELSSAFFVVVPDLRGHGRSTAPEDPAAYHMEVLAADAAALLDHVGLDLCAVVGCGFGGMVALQFAVTWPGRLAGLVVSDSSPAAESDRYDEPFREADRGHLAAEEIVRTYGVAGLARREAAPIGDPFLADGLRNHYTTLDSNGYLGCAQARRRRPDLIPLLREKITCPVLLCSGATDPAAAGMRVISEELPSARVLTFKNTGHAVPVHRPGPFADAVLRFFRDIEQGNPTGGHRTV
ncbi:MAG: alpha/beta hydrolase [Dehalococcoidia bacterium]|nr:alpha/beta hydrolase [Dehalococcoidia bacterium]